VTHAVDECAIEIASLNSMALHKTQKLGNCKKCHVLRGAFKKLVLKVCKEYNLERSELHIETALSRNKVGRKLKVRNCSTQSPMAGIEGHLLAAILRRAAFHQPVYCAEGLELANSMIKGKTAQLDLVAWKQRNLKNGPTDDSFSRPDPATARTFSTAMLTSSAQRKPFDSTANEMIGIG
jgi:hypothetical protein